MNEVNYTDSVILTMLINFKGKMDLINIMMNYDYINHSIITEEEINHALYSLEKYIGIDKNKKIYVLSKAYDLKTKMFDKYSFSKQTDIIYKKLFKEVELDNAKIKKHFTGKDIKKAYEKYTRSINTENNENIFEILLSEYREKNWKNYIKAIGVKIKKSENINIPDDIYAAICFHTDVTWFYESVPALSLQKPIDVLNMKNGDKILKACIMRMS